MSSKSMLMFLIVFFVAAIIGCSETGQDNDGQNDSNALTRSPKTQTAKADPVPTADAYLPTGDDGTGGWIIPSGRRITPATSDGNAEGLYVHMWPINAAISPTGDYLFINMIRGKGVSVIDTANWQVIQYENLKTFNGLVITADGSRLYMTGGGAECIYEFDTTGGVLTELRRIKIMGFPTGLALSPDEQTLYVATSYGHRVAFIDLPSGLEVGTGICQIYPYEVELNADGSRAYVSNWGSSSVSVINTATGQNIANIPVEKNPEGLQFSADYSKLYVACSDADIVSVIDPATNTVSHEIQMLDSAGLLGALPTHMMLDGTKLYVVCSGYNAIAVIDTATDEILGMIPTGWYPSSAIKDPASDTIYYLNGKGVGWQSSVDKGASTTSTVNRFSGAYTTQDLAAYTQQVEDNNRRLTTFYEDLEFESPIPTKVGTPSQQIKRVIFVMKENKTYDQVFGDLSNTNADPQFLEFGNFYTPNAHSLANQFSNCDNFFSSAQASLQGHVWSTATVCNDYVEKSWATQGGMQALSGVEPAAKPNDMLFKHMLNNGVEFRSYGQVVGTVADMDLLAPYVSLKYGFYNMSISDETKIGEVIRDMEAGIWPPFVYISLPNDHTHGSDSGAPTPDWMVADNDSALGKLIDYVSHSDYWDETAIFITQDDPQSGADHVDAHRTIGLVVSPWAKRQYTSSVHYTMNSMLSTIEMIFGIPPLSDYDQYNAPMYDCFTMTADNTPYDALPNQVPFEYNPKGLPYQDYCEKMIWDAPDQVPNLGQVIWAIKRPGEPWPAQYSVDPAFMEDEEEEAEEAAEYRAMAKAWTEYGLKRGITPIKGNLLRPRQN